jgi:cysteinyl-tRNA synthetase
VDYWLHTGHLYIDGLKMSKSLKNFISIRDYLNSNWSTSPANDLRLFFLQHKYHSALHLSKDSLKETAILRNRIEKLFKICHLIRNSNSNNREGTDSATHRPKKLDHHGKALYEAYQRCKIGVNENLRNDFDTPSALNNMMELVSLSNIHALQVLNNNSLSIDPLPAIEIYIKDMLTIFGFDVDSMMDQVLYLFTILYAVLIT